MMSCMQRYLQVLDKMNSDEFEELTGLAQVVVTYTLMLGREDAK